MIKVYFISAVLITFLFGNNIQKGEKVFRKYCWGCHHQTSVAFGPSFEQIANKRTQGEIKAHIIAPKSMYKQLGYKRSVMPSFKDTLSNGELDDITNYILSLKIKSK